MIERSDLSMAQLRKNITSKGGTTQAGLDTLSQYDLVSIFEDCLNAAVDRSIELSNIEDQKQTRQHMYASSQALCLTGYFYKLLLFGKHCLLLCH